MAGPFDFLHIKRRTAGSSNELSFDVLDAARHELDEKRKANRPPLLSSGPRPSQGSYSGVAGTSTLSAVPEVERRKRARRARAIRVRFLVVLALVALVSVGAYMGYRFYMEKVDFTGRVMAQVDQFVEIDKSIVEVDRLMADPLNSVERQARDQALEGFSELDRRLGSVAQEAHDMARDVSSDSDRAALAAIEDAAEARQRMLAAADGAFKLSEIANRQVTEATDAWNEVLSGDATAREATGIANEATNESATVAAREKTREAIEQMSSAKSQLAVIEQGVVGLDFSPEIAYIDKRIESLQAAIETADALLAGDRSAAAAANNAYNAADRDAAEMAGALPDSIGDQVKSCYADEIGFKEGDYAEARASASSADSALRTYLPA